MVDEVGEGWTRLGGRRGELGPDRAPDSGALRAKQAVGQTMTERLWARMRRVFVRLAMPDMMHGPARGARAGRKRAAAARRPDGPGAGSEGEAERSGIRGGGMSEVGRVALLGAGVVGAGWAARFAVNGIDVRVHDPDPRTRGRVGETLADAVRAHSRLTLAPPVPPGRIEVVASLEEAVADADFVQESVPEREEVKRPLLAAASRAAPPEAVIASSTSGLLPSRLQAGCAAPERVLVGHPFIPVYLLPLVEVVGGEATSAEAKERAAACYRAVGMHPLVLDTEVDAFVADRLLEAVWREALHLVNDGVATARQIDEAIAFGPGLRWSVMGTFLLYRLAGGEAGMRHFLEQFGPTLKLPWTRFEGPELTEELMARIAAQSDAQAAGRSIRELTRLRDDCLVSVMQGLRTHDHGAGAVLRTYEAKLFSRAHRAARAEPRDLSRPLDLHTARVAPDWLDYNNHMTESRYLQVFGDATDAVLRFVGADDEYIATGRSFHTVETHIRHLREVAGGEPVSVATQVLGFDEKRVHLFHRMFHGEKGGERGVELATGEHMLLHVDTAAGRAAPAAREILERLESIARAQASLGTPEGAGRRIAMPGAPDRSGDGSAAPAGASAG